jgi:hypothetical protein
VESIRREPVNRRGSNKTGTGTLGNRFYQ